MILSDYTRFGGVFPPTATLKNVLGYHGVTAPHSGAPFEESMLLGISGGLGCGYILWEFESEDYPILVLGFSHRWNYMQDVMETLCRRVGVGTTFYETGGRIKAARQLEEALEAGDPPVAWVDLLDWTYDHHHTRNLVVVIGLDADQDEVIVDDRARTPVRVPRARFAEARAEVPSYKHRLLVVAPPAEVDLEAAIRDGIGDHLDYLGGSSDTFALPALRKWARLLTDPDHKKGWPSVFAGWKGLYSALKSTYEGVELAGTGGGGMRGLYADFLEEAAGALDAPALDDAASLYREAAECWTRLAEAALPDEVGALRETKSLLHRRHTLYRERGSQAGEEIAGLSESLADLKRAHDPRFPLDDEGVRSLLEAMQARLNELYEAETAALAALDVLMSES